MGTAVVTEILNVQNLQFVRPDSSILFTYTFGLSADNLLQTCPIRVYLSWYDTPVFFFLVFFLIVC